MKNINKIITAIVFLFCIGTINTDYNKIYAAPAASTVKTNSQICVSPLDVVNSPEKYLKKNINFTAEFISFSGLGLDYKPAYRDPAKYVGILIRRPDIADHTVPLSEMKIFIKREMAEKFIDINTGDKVTISGTVFSTALGDPWVDVTTMSILTKKPKKDK